MKVEDLIPMVFSERPIGTLPTRKPYDLAIDLKPDLSQSFKSLFTWARSKMKQFEPLYRKISTKVLLDLPISPKPPPSSLFQKKMENLVWYRTIVILTPRPYAMDIHFLISTN